MRFCNHFLFEKCYWTNQWRKKPLAPRFGGTGLQQPNNVSTSTRTHDRGGDSFPPGPELNDRGGGATPHLDQDSRPGEGGGGQFSTPPPELTRPGGGEQFSTSTRTHADRGGGLGGKFSTLTYSLFKLGYKPTDLNHLSFYEILICFLLVTIGCLRGILAPPSPPPPVGGPSPKFPPPVYPLVKIDFWGDIGTSIPPSCWGDSTLSFRPCLSLLSKSIFGDISSVPTLNFERTSLLPRFRHNSFKIFQMVEL